MKLATLSARDSRAVRLGALLLLPVLGYGLLFQPYRRESARARGRLEEERALLVRERRLLSEKASFPKRREQAATLLGSNWTRIVRGSDTVSIAASFAAYVSSAAEDAGLVVEQVESSAGDSASVVRLAAGGLAATTVQLRAHGDLERILHFLSDVETGETFARIDKLALVKQPNIGAADSELLGVTVTVTGIARVLTHPVTEAKSPARVRELANVAKAAR